MKTQTLKVLAIDDNPDNLTVLRAIVADALPDTSILTASNGRQGVDLALAHDPDVVLLDVVMPGIDGFAVCRALKSDERTHHVPVVFLTALKTDRASRIMALEAGGDGFLTKPLDEAELVAQIKAMAKIKAAAMRQYQERDRLAEMVAERTAALEQELAARRTAEAALQQTNRELAQNQSAMLNLLEDLKAENEARKKGEAALRRSREQIEQYLSLVESMILVLDTESRVAMINRKGCDILGYSQPEITGQDWFDHFIPERLRAFMKERCRRIMRGEDAVATYFENPVLTRSGDERLIAWHNSLLRDESGAIAGTISSCEDITERTRMEAAVRALAESAAVSGDDIFRLLVRELAVSLGVRYALATRIAPDDLTTAHILAAWNRDDFGENFSYALEGTPCGNVVEQGICFYPRDVQQLFPDDHLLVDMGAESYCGTPLRDGAGNCLGVLAILDDRPMEERPQTLALLDSFAARAASELVRKRAEEAMREREETYRALVDGLPDIVMRFDGAGRHLFVSDNVRQVVDLEPGQFVGKTHRDLGFPDAQCRFWEDAIRQVCDTGAPFETEFTFEGVQGPTIFNWRLVPEFGVSGAVQSVLSISRDVTAHRRAEHDYHTLFREMLDGFALHEIICDAQGEPEDYRFLGVNPAFERLTGLKAEDILGKTVREVIPGIEPAWIETYGRVTLSGEPAFFEDYSRDLNKHFQVTAFRPAPGRFACIFADVTERKRAEAALEAARVKLEALWNVSSLADADTRTISDHILATLTRMTGSPFGFYGFINPDVSVMTIPAWSGMAMEQCSIVDKPQDFLISEAGMWGESVRRGMPIIVNDYEAEHSGKKGLPPGHVPLTRLMVVPFFSQGRITSVAAVANRLTDYVEDDVNQVNAFLNSIQAIVDSKRAEEALRDSEAALSKAQQLANIGSFIWDLRNDSLIWSDNMYAIAGLSGEGFAGNLKQVAADIIHPVDQAEVARQIESMVAEKQTWPMEFRIVRPDGDIRLLQSTSEFTYDEQGTPVRCIGLHRDITELRRAADEREQLQAQLLQAQKMEAVGRLAGGVAHDFNNMLTAILGYAGLALDEVDSASPLHHHLLEIRQAAQRSADLTRQLLAFARRQTANPQVLDLNDTISGMLKMLQRLIGEDIELVWKPGRALWRVRIDPSQVDQLLANLTVNARDAIVGVGTVSVQTANVVLGDGDCSGHSGLAPGEYVRVTVGDDGCGIDAETQAHIFEPFFTTKEQGKGTGLGLATVYGIVTQNDGCINVISEPGRGTTFEIYLPRYAADVAGAAADVPRAPRGGTETVLLVEDEPALLDLGKAMLARLGYTVLAAGTPAEALRLAEDHRGPIHLLVTDVVMPQMNGRNLAARIMVLKPGLKCIYMSGYTADVIGQHGIVEDGVFFVQKPFTVQTLADRVREALDR